MVTRLVKRILLGAVMLGVLSYGGTCAYMYEEQRHSIFQPSPVLQTTPERLGIKYEVVHIPSGSGSERGELYGWWIPADQPDAPTFLYLHGNDKNISHIHDVAHANRMHSLGYNLLMIDYRGYGLSTGREPSEAKVYEDAESAWNYLVNRLGAQPRPGETKLSRPVFIYGHSLGGAIAIDLAVRHPEASGLVAESTFTNMAAMGKRQYGFLPVDLLLTQHFDSVHKVKRLRVPVLYIHGKMDALIPYRMSQKLYDKSPEPKFLTLIEGGEHGNSSMMGWVEYRDALTAFVNKFSH